MARKQLRGGIGYAIPQQRNISTHLQELDRQAEKEMECLLRKMMESQGVDEALKASDQMMWVRKVNVLRAMAEEVVLREIVYQ